MFSHLKFLVPQTIKRYYWNIRGMYALIACYVYDFARFWHWSIPYMRGDLENLCREQIEAVLIINYHVIEKGLSLRDPRPGFGTKRVEQLIRTLGIYVKRFGLDETAKIASNVLEKYMAFNLEYGTIDEQTKTEISRLAHQTNEFTTDNGGVLELSSEVVLSASRLDLKEFFSSRHSIRHFAEQEVSMDLIISALEMAVHTPSVCNRQSWRVYVISDLAKKQKILDYQNGNRGFGDQADKVLIITTDLRYFVSPNECQQNWIDGGMFAMSLAYAFHSLGLGTCCLHWSTPRDIDRKLRTAASIPDYESVIMLMLVGHLSQHFKVAQSPRKELSEILKVR